MVEYLTMDDTFAALADPTRRAILNQLMAGPARVTDIAAPYSVSLNAISKHVRVLERAHLVSRQVRGRDHWISFNHAPLADARNYVDAMLGSRRDGPDAPAAQVAAGEEQEHD
jgi:DNA-binding transcriptional ArsR family regulator